jgi:hypothetical protein
VNPIEEGIMRVEKPNKVSRSFTQNLSSPAAEVFELLCPVREADWVNDWRPKLVLSESGLAEPGCIFITPGIPEDALWLMTEYDPETFQLEIIKMIPGVVVGRISISLSADGDDSPMPTPRSRTTGTGRWTSSQTTTSKASWRSGRRNSTTI